MKAWPSVHFQVPKNHRDSATTRTIVEKLFRLGLVPCVILRVTRNQGQTTPGVRGKRARPALIVVSRLESPIVVGNQGVRASHLWRHSEPRQTVSYPALVPDCG